MVEMLLALDMKLFLRENNNGDDARRAKELTQVATLPATAAHHGKRECRGKLNVIAGNHRGHEEGHEVQQLATPISAGEA